MFHKRHDEEKRRGFLRKHPFFVLFVLLVATVLWGPTIYANVTTQPRRYELSREGLEAVPKRDTAIVFGAGLAERGTKPSLFLQWRVDAAVELYKAGKVSNILMTGDGGMPDHDEPAIMKQAAIALGVPAERITVDKFGFDTYDSCVRARFERKITSAIVVTQGYHLPRAVWSCQSQGIDTVGVNAQTQVQSWRASWYLAREWLSTDKLCVQILKARYL